MSDDGSGHDKRIGRRNFLKVIGAAGVTATGLRPAQAKNPESLEDPFGILVDTTLCAGCRYCEVVCAEAHGDPEPDPDDAVLNQLRNPSPAQLSVINRFETDAGEIFVKRQCMHCIQPACDSACLTRAMHKTAEGPVVWDAGKCMGCRFCMISCPFDMPTFEYHSAVPRIRKCDMCIDRVQEGGVPACVENCPGEALTFGPRSKLLLEAHKRIAEDPDLYVPEIYGEREVGGTSWLYLAAAPFEQLGFRTQLAKQAYPEFTKEFLYGVPVVLTVVPAFLAALSNATRREDSDAEGESDDVR